MIVAVKMGDGCGIDGGNPQAIGSRGVNQGLSHVLRDIVVAVRAFATAKPREQLAVGHGIEQRAAHAATCLVGRE